MDSCLASADAADLASLEKLGVSEGDPAYVLGFPMGLVGEQRNVPVVRSGCIARMPPPGSRIGQDFLIDAFVFPGNSGGPAVLAPSLHSVDGPSQPRPLLIGVVHEYVPYEEKAVREGTEEWLVRFQHNSGLVRVYPVDAVQACIDEALADIGAPDWLK